MSLDHGSSTKRSHSAADTVTNGDNEDTKLRLSVGMVGNVLGGDACTIALGIICNDTR